MRTLIIDRFEGKYAICEGEEQKFFAIDISELPENAKEGSVIEINAEGNITVNEDKADEIRKRIGAKQKKLFGR